LEYATPEAAPAGGELAHERGLADARLPAHQHEPAAGAVQEIEKRLALEEQRGDHLSLDPTGRWWIQAQATSRSF
jgi:hypothetical protein